MPPERAHAGGVRSWPASFTREHPARQRDNEFGKFIDLAVHRDRATICLRHDVVGDGQAEPGALAAWPGGEERLEQLVSDVFRRANLAQTQC